MAVGQRLKGRIISINQYSFYYSKKQQLTQPQLKLRAK